MTVRIRERDALDTAVLVSILLHVVLLNALPGWREWQQSQSQVPVPILARVLPEQFPAERAADLPQERAALLPQSSPSVTRPSPPKRSEPQRAEASVREVLAPAVNEPESTQDSSKRAAEPSTSVAGASVTAPRSEPVSPPPAAPTADAGTLAQYRLAIISIAKGFNRYPRIAVENSWQGRTEVRMTVRADGTIASLGLRSGSGHEILDRQALDMIGNAAPQVPLPAQLRGREFALDIPVIFSLNEVAR
jgi:protein TonB